MRYDRPIDCLAAPGAPARTVHALRPDGVEALAARLPPAAAAFLRQSGASGEEGEITLLPGPEGVAAAALGLGGGAGFWGWGALPFGLPEGDWASAEADALAFCLGAYRYPGRPGRAPAKLVAEAPEAARAVWLARDLINTPANLLGPTALAGAAETVAARFGARFERIEGAALLEGYPCLASVGAGAARAPVVAKLAWSGSGAGAEAPLVSLCGKGVCFDTGGLDLKPSAAMLRMKKDMGGAAVMLGLAALLMAADRPIRLELRLGCVENAVSATAMRPGDVLATRKGLSVEIGNTDAEGRLVLADLLAEAAEGAPALLLDAATLTGAARVALGPDLPALFTDDEALAEAALAAGRAAHDPLWRLPLWDGYDSWLKSPVADLNNVGSKPMAGAVTAALFLRRFVPAGMRWAHVDLYAWNDAARPGRPEGGEAQALRALDAAICRLLHLPDSRRIMPVT